MLFLPFTQEGRQFLTTSKLHQIQQQITNYTSLFNYSVIFNTLYMCIRLQMYLKHHSVHYTCLGHTCMCIVLT